MRNPWLHRYAILLAVCTLFLVMAGASVTSKEAGLSVPDWPLSYGQVMPEMQGGVFYEHGHRMVATTVGILTIGLVILLFMFDTRSWMRKLGLAALAAVIVQGVLGGMTVLFLLPPAVSVSHACLAQLFFSCTMAIVLFTSKRWEQPSEIVPDHGWPSLRTLSVLSGVAVLIQIALGAAFRHKALGLLPHIIGAMLVALILLIVAAFVLHQFPQHKPLRSSAMHLLGMTFFQVALGIAAYVGRMQTNPSIMMLTTIAHVAGGGLTLAASVTLSIQVFRNVRPRTSATASQAAVTS